MSVNGAAFRQVRVACETLITGEIVWGAWEAEQHVCARVGPLGSSNWMTRARVALRLMADGWPARASLLSASRIIGACVGLVASAVFHLHSFFRHG
eukprot:scaffold4391_cov120-Isochrysis_galbana.AAC.5